MDGSNEIHEAHDMRIKDCEPTGKEWYALYAQINHEREVTKRLICKEITSFLPLMTCWSKRLDRRKKIQVPLFPGYIFVHVVLDNHTNLNIVKTSGAVCLLGNSEGPISIPSYQIENLYTMLNSSQPLSTHDYMREGDLVRVRRGPLTGCIGILNRIDAKRGRLVVSVDIIKKSVAVEIDIEDAELNSSR